MHFSLKFIKSLLADPDFPDRTYRFDRAVKLYLKDMFGEVKVSNYKGGNQRQVEAHFKYVHSQSESCNTVIRFQPPFDNVDISCDCYYGRADVIRCEHVGAVLLLLNEIDFSQPFYLYSEHRQELVAKRKEQYELLKMEEQNGVLKEETTTLISEAADLYQANYLTEPTVAEPIKLFVNLDWRKDNPKQLAASFSVGNKRMYVIHDVREFMNNVYSEKTVAYGVNLQFNHCLSSFDEPSREIIALMNYLLPLPPKSNSYHAAERTIYNNLVNVEEKSLDRVFKVVSSFPDYTNCVCTENPNKIVIKAFTDNGNDLAVEALALDDLHTMVSEKAIYIVGKDGHSIQRFSNIHSQPALRMINKLKVNHRLVVDEKQINNFIRYIYQPTCQEFYWQGYKWSVSQAMEKTIKLYGDADDKGNITFEVQCVYEDGTLRSGLDEQNNLRSGTCLAVVEALKTYGADLNKKPNLALMNPFKEDTKVFILKVLPKMNKQIEVYVSDVIQEIGTKREFVPVIKISYCTHLIELDVSSSEYSHEDLAELIAAYRHKQFFHRLKDGRVVSLYSDSLAQLDDFMCQQGITTEQLAAGQISLPASRAITLQADKNNQLEFDRDKTFKALLDQIETSQTKKIVLPEYYEKTLRDYQKEGVQWMARLGELQFSGILADDMGLGKTLEVIALIETEKRRPCLVVCPSSLIMNWGDEVKKFGQTINALCIFGPADSRSYLIDQIKDYNLAITSYDYLRRDIDLYTDIDFDTVILDEAQYIKNGDSINARTVKKLKAKHRLALTGTPIENYLSELWSIFDFLMPGYLYTAKEFKDNIEERIVYLHDEKVSQKLKQMVEPFILRRTKAEVLKELPLKQESVVYLDFGDEERKNYLNAVVKAMSFIKSDKSTLMNAKFRMFSEITRLRQICAEPRILFDNITTVGAKLQGCMELLSSLKESGKKTLLFSSFTTALELIRQQCEQQNISYLIMTGATSKEDRHKMVEQFQNGEADVFLISLKSGGTGLNLTAAEAVIHYDPWWNMAAQNQATDRAYRIGQNKNVMVYKLIMKDSIEEKILNLQKIKKDLSDTFVEGNEGTIMDMSVDEIVKLFEL